MQIYLENKQYSKITGTVVKRAYVLCARSYVSDYVIYISMATPLNDVFYQDV